MRSAKTIEERAEARLNFINSMKHLELDLKERNTKFFDGNDLPGMLDYMIWPWLERIEILPMIFSDVKDLLPAEDFPLMVILNFLPK